MVLEEDPLFLLVDVQGYSARFLDLSAAIRAPVSTKAPRPVLTKYAPSFMRAKLWALILYRVSLVEGVCKVTSLGHQP